MNARTKTYETLNRAELRGIALDFDAAESLRRISMTLHRWSEQECGDGNDYASWAIERDEETGKPYRCVYPHKGTMRRYSIADREKGALKRLEKLSKEHGFHWFYQSDPRGCPLYIAREPLTEANYTNGLAI